MSDHCASPAPGSKPISACGGGRAGQTAGGVVGSPMCPNICSITGRSRTKAMILMGPPHAGHNNGRHS